MLVNKLDRGYLVQHGKYFLELMSQMSIREVHERVTREGIVNPLSGKPIHIMSMYNSAWRYGLLNPEFLRELMKKEVESQGRAFEEDDFRIAIAKRIYNRKRSPIISREVAKDLIEKYKLWEFRP